MIGRKTLLKDLFKWWFRHKVVGRSFVHSLVDSLGQINQGLDVHYVKTSNKIKS